MLNFVLWWPFCFLAAILFFTPEIAAGGQDLFTYKKNVGGHFVFGGHFGFWRPFCFSLFGCEQSTSTSTRNFGLLTQKLSELCSNLLSAPPCHPGTL